MKELDLKKILKNAPKGLKLYSPLVGGVKFDRIVGVSARDIPSIYVTTDDGYDIALLNNGKYVDFKNAECMLFPSKKWRDWDDFKIPKVGDLVKLEGDNFTCKVSKLMSDGFRTMKDGKLYCGDVSYLYNFEIVEEPKFKVGDIVIVDKNELRIIINIDAIGYLTEEVFNDLNPMQRHYRGSEMKLATKEELRDERNLMINKERKLVRWMPKYEEGYYYINNIGHINTTINENSHFDEFALKIKNCFPTKKLAQEKLKEVIEIFK